MHRVEGCVSCRGVDNVVLRSGGKGRGWSSARKEFELKTSERNRCQ